MKKSKLKQIIKEEIKKIFNTKSENLEPNELKNISESQQINSLEQQAKDFVLKYGKVKIKI